MRRFREARNSLILCRNRWRDRKTHVYHRCPHCRAMLRLPRRPGFHGVTCPRCSRHFDMTVK